MTPYEWAKLNAACVAYATMPNNLRKIAEAFGLTPDQILAAHAACGAVSGVHGNPNGVSGVQKIEAGHAACAPPPQGEEKP